MSTIDMLANLIVKHPTTASRLSLLGTAAFTGRRRTGSTLPKVQCVTEHNRLCEWHSLLICFKIVMLLDNHVMVLLKIVL